MSERKSDALCLEAVYAAHTIFKQREGTLSSLDYKNYTDEFIALQSIAGIRLAQPAMPEQDVQTERRLDMNLPDLLTDLKAHSGITVHASKPLKTKVTNVLTDEHIPLFRGLLAMGYEDVKAMHNLGVLGLDFLNRVKDAVAPHIDWSPMLDGSHAAQLYPSLNKVPVRIIDRELRGTEEAIGNVENLLGVSLTFLRKHLEQSSEYEATKPNAEVNLEKKLQEIRQKAHNFALEFTNQPTTSATIKK